MIFSLRSITTFCLSAWLAVGITHSSHADSSAIKANARAIFSSTHQMDLGNPGGDVTLVEFLDYNCGFCKSTVGETLTLLKREPNLKVVIKQFPVLGPGSIEAARVAVAVHMQDTGGLLDSDEKSLAFHRQLMSFRGGANKAVALNIARQIGCDMTRLQRDLNSKDIDNSLEEVRRLAALLGINGTPAYVIGDQVLYGAAGIDALSNQIKVARSAGTAALRR